MNSTEINIPAIIKSLLPNSVTPTNELSEFCKKLEVQSFSKGNEFCKVGRPCNKLGILVDGLLVATFNSHREKLSVSRFFFTPQNRIVVNFGSFKTGKPSNETIKVLEDSMLLTITAKDLNELYEIYPMANTFGRHLAEESYLLALERIHDLQICNNQERIINFYNKKSDLFNRVSKKYLSSYLRVNRNDITATLKRKIKGNKNARNVAFMDEVDSYFCV